MRVVLLSDLKLREEAAIQLERRREVVQSLLKVSILEVCLSKLRVGRHEDEKVLLVDVYKQLAEGQLLNSHLDYSSQVLGEGELIKRLVAFNYI